MKDIRKLLLQKAKKEFYKKLQSKKSINFEDFYYSFIINKKGNLFLVGSDEKLAFFGKNKEVYNLKIQELLNFKAKNVLAFKVKKEEIIDYFMSKKLIDSYLELTNIKITKNFIPTFGVKSYLDFQPKINYLLDNLINEKLLAKDQILEMYKLFNKGRIFEEQIPILLSLGLLGKDKREIDSEQAISAYQSVVGDYLKEKIKEFEIIDRERAFYFEKFGNKVFIFFLKDSLKFEIIEKIGQKTFKDKETNNKIKNPNTAGAYYAFRMACFEKLNELKKQAKILVVRIIGNYEYPLGSWFLMELARKALSNEIDFEKAKKEVEKFGIRFNNTKQLNINRFLVSSFNSNFNATRKF